MWTTARTFVTTGLAALTIAGMTLATASQAEAHNNFGRGVFAGIAGGVASGALIADAAHTPGYGTPIDASPHGAPPVRQGSPPVAT